MLDHQISLNFTLFISYIAKQLPSDFGIVFGANGKNAPSNFVAEKSFIKSTIQKFSAGWPNLKFGTIVYSGEARIVFKFSDNHSSRFAISAIQKLERKRRGNNLFAALDLARRELFDIQNGGRRNATKTLLVLTDSASGKDEKVLEAAQKLKDENVKIILVTIGEQPGAKAIEDISTDRNSLIRTNDLSKEAGKLIKQIESQISDGELTFKFKIFYYLMNFL